MLRSFVILGSTLLGILPASIAFAQSPGSASFPDAPASAAPTSTSAPPPAPTSPPGAAPPPGTAPAPVTPAPSPAPAPAAPEAAPAPTTPAPTTPPPAVPPAAPEQPPGAVPLAPGAFPPPAPGQDVFSTVPRSEPVWPPRLVESPGWFGGLEGYGGILTLAGSDTRGAYAFAGGQARLRYRYFELGGYLELSDHNRRDDFTAFGGFVGAWLPYRGWVDFEIALSVGARNYQSTDPRYGPDGYDATSPTLGLRLGLSDRTSDHSAFAGRVGGQIFMSYDLDPSDEAWSVTVEDDEGETSTERGATRVGGFTIGLALVIGFDVGRAVTPSPGASESRGLR